MNKTLGYIHFWLTFISAYMVFFPMHFQGLAGVPRRYYTFDILPEFAPWLDVNVFITMAAILGGVAQIIFLWNFFSSIFAGEKSSQNPWGANTLEWTSPVEHIHGNWPGEIPTVYRWPYDYSLPDMDEDFVPQNVPDEGSSEEIHVTPVNPVSSDAKKEPEESNVMFFTMVKNWFGLGRA